MPVHPTDSSLNGLKRSIRTQVQPIGDRGPLPTEKPFHHSNLLRRSLNRPSPQLGQQPKLSQLMSPHPQPLNSLTKPRSRRNRIIPRHRLNRPQRTIGLQHIPPLSELRQQQPPKLVEPTAFPQHGAQLSLIRIPSPQEIQTEPKPVQPKHPKQPLPRLLSHIHRTRGRNEPPSRQQQRHGRTITRRRDRLQISEILGAHGRRSLSKQTSHGQHRMYQTANPGISPIPGSDLARVRDRVLIPATDLIGTRQHTHSVHRTAVGSVAVVEGIEEIDVRGVQVPHQIQHSVHTGRFAEKVLRTTTRRLGQRPHARSVHKGHLAEPVTRQRHLDPVDRLDIKRAQVESVTAAVVVDGKSDRPCAVRESGRARFRATEVPRDDPSALAGVGRGDPGADECVEQSGLTGLHPARDRHPERSVEVPGHVGQHAAALSALVRLDRVVEQRPDSCGKGNCHDRPFCVTRSALASNAETRSSSALAAAPRVAAACASACTARIAASCSCFAADTSSCAWSR